MLRVRWLAYQFVVHAFVCVCVPDYTRDIARTRIRADGVHSAVGTVCWAAYGDMAWPERQEQTTDGRTGGRRTDGQAMSRRRRRRRWGGRRKAEGRAP